MAQASTTQSPAISVVVPTFARPDRIRALVERLARQTLPPTQFEVIVVDDGSPEPVRIEPSTLAGALLVLRQTNAGPAAARNLGVSKARAPLVIFLNDDALPADDLLAVHVEVHRALRGSKVAVLGTFPFTQRSLEEPFTRLLAQSDLLFDFPRLRHGELHSWQFFWTCNLSLPVAALREVGGFDAERFREAIVEDVELGYRLERAGWRVLHRSDARCEHEHALTVDDYFRRAVRLGVNLARMAKKHDDLGVMWLRRGPGVLEAFLRTALANVEAFHPTLERFLETARRFAAEARGRELGAEESAGMSKLTRQMSTVAVWRGMLLECTGQDPWPTLEEGPAKGRLVSIIVPSFDALAKTQNCLAALRATRDEAHPTEILFVDNGSRDGSREWLAAQADVTLIANETNLGAPRARNQALARARGEYVVFLDNDVVVGPGWLERLLYHAELDAQCACVGACADRASHGQELPAPIFTQWSDVAAHANAIAATNHRKARATALLASFCLLVKRSVIERLGGFDERFSPWGFEDDDYTLRALLAGYHNRVALDVFVRHDSYSDAEKSARHDALLAQHWRALCDKWGVPNTTPYGHYSAFEALRGQPVNPARLFVRYASEPPAPLPAKPIQVETS